MKEFKEISEWLLINDDEEEEIINQEIFTKVLKNIKKLKNIDTTNVEPAFFPYQIAKTFMWEDGNDKVIDQEIFLKNTTTKNNYVVVKLGGKDGQ